MTDPWESRLAAARAWYADRNCTHAHCPTGHDKPQPELVGGRMLCMYCRHVRGEDVEVVPCTPETCAEAQP